MTLAAVIPIYGTYSRYWPRVWSEVARQIAAGAPLAEIVVARPSGSGPPPAKLSEALERVTRMPAPPIREWEGPDADVPVGAVRDAALELVGSRLVAFMDVDDYLAPGIWRELCTVHDRNPGLGSAAGASIARFSDGSVAGLGARAHRLRRPRHFDPRSRWHQALLWALSIESAVLAPGAGGVHAVATVRECGGYGRTPMDDMVLGAASVSCAPASYLPRRVARLWQIREGSWWSRPQSRRAILEGHDEMAARLDRLAAEGQCRPDLAWAGPGARLLLSIRRRHLERTEMRWSGDFAIPGSRKLVPRTPELSAWLEGAARAEHEMAGHLC